MMLGLAENGKRGATPLFLGLFMANLCITWKIYIKSKLARLDFCIRNRFFFEID